MPRQSSITPEAVAEAAERLIARGQPVTNQAVHALLGGGSMSTLVPMVRAWKAEQKERDAIERVYVPEPVAQLAQELAARLWRNAQQEAGVATDALGRELRALRQEFAATNAELEENLKLAERQHLEAEKARHDAENDAHTLRSVYDELNLDYARVTEKIKSLEEKVSDLQVALGKAELRAERAEERLSAIARGAS